MGNNNYHYVYSKPNARTTAQARPGLTAHGVGLPGPRRWGWTHKHPQVLATWDGASEAMRAGWILTGSETLRFQSSYSRSVCCVGRVDAQDARRRRGSGT